MTPRPQTSAERARRITGCATLGMEIHEDPARAGAHVDATLSATQDCHGRMARGAMLVLADQALASGVFAAFGAGQAMMTLDLRTDWLALPPRGATIEACVERVIRHGNIVAVYGVLVAQGDLPRTIVATSCARFLTGAFPGGGDVMADLPHNDAQASTAADFAALLALQAGYDEAVLPPNAALIGSPMLPAVHGGFIAAALEAASSALVPAMPGWAAVNIEVRYIRPALATAPLHIVPKLLRASRRTLIIEAQALQGDDRKLVATAKLMFFHSDAADAPVEVVNLARAT